MGGPLSKNKEQQLLADVQGWIKVLDHTVYSLAKTIDVMQASARVVVCQLDAMLIDMKENSTAGGYSSNEKYLHTYGAAYQLLGEIKGTVEDQKLYTLETVGNFLNRICPLLKKHKVTSSNIEYSPQSINTYLKNKGTATAQSSPEDKVFSLEFDVHHFSEENKKKMRKETKEPNSSKDNKNAEKEDAATTSRNQKSTGQREDKQIQTSLDSDNTETEEGQQLKLENMQLKQEKIKTESDKDMLNDKILKLKTECTDLQTKLDELKANEHEELSIQTRVTEERDTQICDMKCQIQSLESKVKMLEETNNVIDKQLQTLKNKKVLKVQLFCQPRGGLVSTVEDELMLQLKNKFEDDDNKLRFIQCVNTSEVKPDIPVLVLCISASRIGTDVANMLQGIQLTSKVSLLIFHHKDVHALPNQASDRILSGPQFENAGGIFDMAFLSNKGIYPCCMNDNSFISILNFLNREGIFMNVNEC